MSEDNVNPIEHAVSTITSSLLVRAQTSDDDAWRRLVHIYSPLVYKWCRKRGLQPHDARDIGQQVFQAVARHIPDFRREQSQDTFRGWLRTITENKIRDFWRRQHGIDQPMGNYDRIAATETEDWKPNADDEGSDEQDVNDVFARILDYARQHVNEKHWTIFWRVVVEGQRAVDVAADLGVKRSYVDKNKARVFAKLREAFGYMFPDQGMDENGKQQTEERQK